MKVYCRFRLREWRQHLDCTQEELSSWTGVPAVTLSRLENNKRMPNLTTLVKLALALGVNLDDLVTYGREPNPQKALGSKGQE